MYPYYLYYSVLYALSDMDVLLINLFRKRLWDSYKFIMYLYCSMYSYNSYIVHYSTFKLLQNSKLIKFIPKKQIMKLTIDR